MVRNNNNNITANPGPKAEHAKWSKLHVKVHTHPSYHWYPPLAGLPVADERKRQLLLSLYRFNMSMLAICHFQTWNQRNPSPYIP